MRLLVLGGTSFLGRAVVEGALARGDEPTLFHRGITGPELFPEAEHVHGDREGDLSGLAGRGWDAVVDTSGYVPHVVRASAGLLAPSCAHYAFVSSISVYRDHAERVHEDSPLAELGDLPADRLLPDYANYGALKALCEREAEAAFPGRALAVRAGLIVGPHDPTGRFSYWPHRFARGGEVLAPGPPGRPVQFVDVRDLAAWILDAADRRLAGAFNAASAPYALEDVLAACDEAGEARAAVTWVDEAFLLEHGVGQWLELPLWFAAEPVAERFHEAETAKAHEAGLSHRPLADTARATLAGARTVDGVGLRPERERELLAAWRGRR